MGLLYGAVGVGALAASLGVASLGDFRRIRWLLIGGSLLFTLSLVGFGLSQVMWLSLIALFLLGAGQQTFNSCNSTMLQQYLPDEFRGRATAIYLASQSFQAPGALAIGAVAEVTGVGMAEVGAGLAAGALLMGINVLFRPGDGRAPPKAGLQAAGSVAERDT